MYNLDEESTTKSRRLEEYRQTQSLLAETLEIGRETTKQLSSQQDSLVKAQETVAETEYYVETSNRWLRGRTWTGWITNLLTSPPLPPSTSTSTGSTTANDHSTTTIDTPILGPHPEDSSLLDRLYKLEIFPPSTWEAVQSVRNYHSHVLLLLQKETSSSRTPSSQANTLLEVCQHLQSYAIQQLKQITHPPTHLFLSNQMKQLQKHHPPTKQMPYGNTTSVNSTPAVAKAVITATDTSSSSVIQQQQEEYLNSLLPGLQELQNLSEAIGSSIQHQNQTLETLNRKTEQLHDQTQLVIRRSERIIDNNTTKFSQKKLWETVQDQVCILHCSTNQYIYILEDDRVGWTGTFSQASKFHLFKYKHSYAFQNIYTKKWLGIIPSFFGSTIVGCSATTLGEQEQWELDDDCFKTTATRLLSSNANWGIGGYIQVQENNTLSVPRKNTTAADQWRIIPC